MWRPERCKALQFFLAVIAILVTLSSGSFGAPNLGTWQPGNFEIHIFREWRTTGPADSQLIVSPSGKTLLIDLGEVTWNSGGNADWIAAKLQQVMGERFRRLDYVMISHWHVDHYGAVPYGGVWKLVEQLGFEVGTTIDRDGAAWIDADADGECEADEIEWRNIGEYGATTLAWICYATNPYNTTLNRQTPVLGWDQIDLGPEVGVQIVRFDAEGVPALSGDKRHTGLSENHYSIAARVRFGWLDYLTAGDSVGVNNPASRQYDVESEIWDRLQEEVEILRANHHGSGSSSSQAYVSNLNPDVSIIHCGDRYGHPAQSIIDRLLFSFPTERALFLPNVCTQDRNYHTAVIPDDDVVVISMDGVNYTVNGVPFQARP